MPNVAKVLIFSISAQKARKQLGKKLSAVSDEMTDNMYSLKWFFVFAIKMLDNLLDFSDHEQVCTH